MITAAQQKVFFRRALTAAAEGKHIWPLYAVCEAALESAWGTSQLARLANNLFGQKQGRQFALPYPCVDMATREIYDSGRTPVTERAVWLIFPDWRTCFAERMALLRRLPLKYGEALEALTGEQFVLEVSGFWETDQNGNDVYVPRWATDPARPVNVLRTYRAHRGDLNALAVELKIPIQLGRKA